MLDAFIIDELKRREHEERDEDGRPRLEVPADEEPVSGGDQDGGGNGGGDDDHDDEKRDRGIVVIDL
ncbi:MAG: hypothetical protein HY903_13930 [Deltaproteobacteria bacterium]|nr:hypothetical protein [Deltaproteobacteria bacterium]